MRAHTLLFHVEIGMLLARFIVLRQAAGLYRLDCD